MRARQVAEVALNVPAFEYDPAVAAKASNPNRRRKWLIPVVLAVQVRVAERHALRTALMRNNSRACSYVR